MPAIAHINDESMDTFDVFNGWFYCFRELLLYALVFVFFFFKIVFFVVGCLGHDFSRACDPQASKVPIFWMCHFNGSRWTAVFLTKTWESV